MAGMGGKRGRQSWFDRLEKETIRPARKPRERIHLGPVYVLLIVLVLVATAVSIIWSGEPLLDRFGPNIATESLGILLTVVFVRRFMEQGERSRRLRASVGALRKARRSLQDLVEVWATTLKGCLPARERNELTTVVQLCTPDQSELLVWCDPTVRRGGREDERWVRWAGRQVRAAQDQLDEVIATYAGTLDPEYVEAMDALTSDPFLRGFADLAAGDVEPQPWRVALNTVRALRMAHFERLLRTIELHNRLAAEVAAVRGRNATPRTSMLGVELPADHDLKIDTALDDGWWRSWPRPGTLRMADPLRPAHDIAAGGHEGD
jgi:hypothetical protein